MRVFTDGACANNGKSKSKAGFAAWFPEHPDWSEGKRLESLPQTNNRAELSAIQLAAEILERRGCLDEDIVIYSDSEYCINCLTKWIPGWMARGWKTADGKDVSNRDLIEDISGRLSKFKSYRFHHVRAHTGGSDDLSKQNDAVDRLARSTIDDTVAPIAPPTVVDDIFPGCPLRLMGAPISKAEVSRWIRANLDTLDADVVDKHLLKAFVELCGVRDVNITKQTIQRTPMLRAERGHLQIDRVVIEKIE